jgi:hypothetical protein
MIGKRNRFALELHLARFDLLQDGCKRSISFFRASLNGPPARGRTSVGSARDRLENVSDRTGDRVQALRKVDSFVFLRIGIE